MKSKKLDELMKLLKEFERLEKIKNELINKIIFSEFRDTEEIENFLKKRKIKIKKKFKY